MSQHKYNKKCVCEYLGTNYSGWQYQDNAHTIQEAIESALANLYKAEIRILGSGRTDAGVHAWRQVFSYKSDIFRDNFNIKIALNNLLPKDISIIAVEDVPTDFHPIANAISKTYCYKLLNRDTRGAIEYNRAWNVYKSIDIIKLTAILQVLVGTHDFTSFCMAKSLKDDPVRTINFITVDKVKDMVDIRLNADGFLHNMIRIIVGTAVELTNMESTIEEATVAISEMIDAKCRRKSLYTAPANGLYLEDVFYE